MVAEELTSIGKVDVAGSLETIAHLAEVGILLIELNKFVTTRSDSH